tara:strand:+ start:248 stop:466 length:219 start_codon:yes stop_codon:yes gene_type:complete
MINTLVLLALVWIIMQQLKYEQAKPKIMYIDERLIKILETHKEEQIHVSYAIDLIKKIAEEYDAQSKTQKSI